MSKKPTLEQLDSSVKETINNMVNKSLSIPSDLNNATTTGFYWCPSSITTANRPTIGDCFVMVMYSSISNIVKQVAYDAYSKTEYARRRSMSGTWTAWEEVGSSSVTASSSTIVDSGNYYTSANVEDTLQEIGQTLNNIRGSLITSTNSILGS